MDFDRLLDVVVWGALAAFVSTIAAGLARTAMKRLGKRLAGKGEDVPPLPPLNFETNNGVLDNPEVAEALKYLVEVHKNAQKGNQLLPIYPQITAAHVATLSTPQQKYEITDYLADGDLCDVYRATFTRNGRRVEGVLKVARNREDNDLVQHEATILGHLHSSDRENKFTPFLPILQEGFFYQQPGSTEQLQANLLTMHQEIPTPLELYTLKEVRAHYQTGIDPADMAWMWRRLISVIGFAHYADVIHGAVLPTHVLIEPKDHKLLLIDWSYAVQNPAKTGQHIRALSNAYEQWYPSEVFDRTPPTPGTDIHMAAECMLYLLGQNPPFDAYKVSMEAPLQSYFAKCLNPSMAARPQAAWDMLEEFDRILETLWGERSFRVFKMPSKIASV